jgi:PPOX class probable FMN-dependent enzyme
MNDADSITSIEALRALYAAPSERVVKKQLTRLDAHCLRFVGLSPFVVIASGSVAHAMDASPRGGMPGFVKAIDERTLLIPDAAGNNRLDTLENIFATGQVGLLFLIPGIDETLRVNGRARLLCGEAALKFFAGEKRVPKVVVEVKVEAAYLHCPKSLMRAKLWDASAQVERSTLPTIAQMINEQTGIVVPIPTQEEAQARFAADL